MRSPKIVCKQDAEVKERITNVKCGSSDGWICDGALGNLHSAAVRLAAAASQIHLCDADTPAISANKSRTDLLLLCIYSPMIEAVWSKSNWWDWDLWLINWLPSLLWQNVYCCYYRDPQI